jgi:hypothetical protein
MTMHDNRAASHLEQRDPNMTNLTPRLPRREKPRLPQYRVLFPFLRFFQPESKWVPASPEAI